MLTLDCVLWKYQVVLCLFMSLCYIFLSSSSPYFACTPKYDDKILRNNFVSIKIFLMHTHTHAILIVLLKFNQFSVLCAPYSNENIHKWIANKRKITICWLHVCAIRFEFAYGETTMPTNFPCNRYPSMLRCWKSFFLQYVIKLVIERNKICTVDIFILVVHIVLSIRFLATRFGNYFSWNTPNIIELHEHKEKTENKRKRRDRQGDEKRDHAIKFIWIYW